MLETHSSIFTRKAIEAWILDHYELPRERPDYAICHGDLHTENVHFSDDGGLTLFDFDCFGYGWRAYDLATFLWSRFLFEPTAESQARNWAAFLTGYREERTLPDPVLESIPYFTVMRQIWVMGIHTGSATEHYGRRWLNDKYAKKHFGMIRRLAEILP